MLSLIFYLYTFVNEYKSVIFINNINNIFKILFLPHNILNIKIFTIFKKKNFSLYFFKIIICLIYLYLLLYFSINYKLSLYRFKLSIFLIIHKQQYFHFNIFQLIISFQPYLKKNLFHSYF